MNTVELRQRWFQLLFTCERQHFGDAIVASASGSMCPEYNSLSRLARLATVKGMKVVNMHEAKTTLSQIIEQVERGEEVVIARAGVPVARLVAIRAGAHRRLGPWRGRVRMAPDFDAPLSPDEQRAWEGDA